MRTFGVGVVGLGRSGWDLHLPALDRHSGFMVRAVADPVEDRRNEARTTYGCEVSADSSDMFRVDDVDVVVLATPSHMHAEMAVDALDAGAHVVVEKQMADTAAEVNQMIAAADRAGRLVTCFHQRRFEPALAAVRDVLDSGRLGRLVHIRLTLNHYVPRSDWQTIRARGGGELSNHGSHLVDLALAMLGEQSVVVEFADLQHTVTAGDAEDHVKVVLRGDDGVVVDIEISLCAAYARNEWEIIGTTGSIRCETPDQMSVRWLDADNLSPVPDADEGPAQGRRYGSAQELHWRDETFTFDRSGLVAAFYDDFHAALTNGRPPTVTPESVRQQIELIETARSLAVQWR